MCEVVNKHWQEWDINIARGTIWGNPYTHREGTAALYKVETVEQAISCYRKHLWSLIRSGDITLSQLRALSGRKLGCTCKPRPCHGDVIKAAVEWAMSRKSDVLY